jgi:hypothetical protein
MGAPAYSLPARGRKLNKMCGAYNSNLWRECYWIIRIRIRFRIIPEIRIGRLRLIPPIIKERSATEIAISGRDKSPGLELL